MSLHRVNADRVMERTTTAGTGDLTLSGAVAGFRTFADGVGGGGLCYYAIEAVDGFDVPTGAWEVGLGTLSGDGATLARTTVLAGSNGGSAVDFAAGTKRAFVTCPAALLDLLALPPQTGHSGQFLSTDGS